jgi:hypothetical protein
VKVEEAEVTVTQEPEEEKPFNPSLRKRVGFPH